MLGMAIPSSFNAVGCAFQRNKIMEALVAQKIDIEMCCIAKNGSPCFEARVGDTVLVLNGNASFEAVIESIPSAEVVSVSYESGASMVRSEIPTTAIRALMLGD